MTKHPELIPIKSTVASGYHYDPQRQELHVKFANGSVHRYSDVPIDKAETLAGAASFGSMLNRTILGKHPSVKL